MLMAVVTHSSIIFSRIHLIYEDSSFLGDAKSNWIEDEEQLLELPRHLFNICKWI